MMLYLEDDKKIFLHRGFTPNRSKQTRISIILDYVNAFSKNIFCRLNLINLSPKALVKAEDSSLVITAPETKDIEGRQSGLNNNLESNDEGNSAKENNNSEGQGKKQTAEIQLSLPEDASVVSGSTISIPVLLTNQKGKEISSYSFAVHFDPEVLESDESAIETMNSLSQNGFVIVSDTNQRGRIGIAASALNNSVSDSGMLLYLRFKVLGSLKDENKSAIKLRFETAKKDNTASMFADTLGNRVSSVSTNGFFSVVAKQKD